MITLGILVVNNFLFKIENKFSLRYNVVEGDDNMKNNYINEEIGVRLKDLRQKADYSLQDIAERVGISRFTYYNFERGRRTISVDLLKKICDAYNYNYLELLEDVHQSYVRYVSQNSDIILKELEDGDK